MHPEPRLIVEGEVDAPAKLTYDDLCAFPASRQIIDVSRLVPSRRGDAVTLAGLLQRIRVRETAMYLGLHSSTDDFHASIPLAPVRDHGFLIYRIDGQPLSAKAGGPFRFFIPDSASCHTNEIDECANVKFVDRIELTRHKGFDNRPEDDEQHQALHRRS
jgi:DMSO/TMAO reductase YedYZ molybdopterin-dependent catalytic subunit